jgi:hypothetical protein
VTEKVTVCKKLGIRNVVSGNAWETEDLDGPLVPCYEALNNIGPEKRFH